MYQSENKTFTLHSCQSNKFSSFMIHTGVFRLLPDSGNAIFGVTNESVYYYYDGVIDTNDTMNSRKDMLIRSS